MILRICLITLTSLYSIIASAQKDYEQLLDSLYNKQNRPVVVLNYTSSDCVNCRLGVSSMLPALTNKIGSSHIEILTDHKNQLRYLNRFSEVFGKFKVKVSKELSESLSQDGSSKLYVLGKDKIIAYSLNSSNDSLVNDITESYNRLATTSGAKVVLTKLREYTSIDTVFDPSEPMFEASSDKAILFSRKFQIGKQCNLKNGTNKDFEFTANKDLVTKLNKMLAGYDPRIYVSPDSAMKVLNTVTLPMIYIENLRITSGKCYVAFKYNSVTIDGGTKDDPDIGIRPRYFIGMLNLDKAEINISNLAQCEQFYLIDTALFKGQAYRSDFWSAIDIKDNRIAIRGNKEKEKDQKSDTTLHISSFSTTTKNKPKLEAVNHFEKFKQSDQLILRLSKPGQFIIWDQTIKEFRNDRNEIMIPTKQLNGLGLTYVYDFFIDGNGLHVLGVINNKQSALVKFANNGTASIKAYFDDSSFCDEFRFSDKNNLVGYLKDSKKNTLKIITYSYSMAKPETP